MVNRLDLGVNASRSTKAGAETPATGGVASSLGCNEGTKPRRQASPPGIAQRRPEPKPRRPRRQRGDSFRSLGRHPAQRRPSRNPGDSSTKAGAETPATAELSSLNEGRSRNPGDSLAIPPRSTKAGAETPATGRGDCSTNEPKPRRQIDGVGALNEGRSRNPGDSRPQWLSLLNEGRSKWRQTPDELSRSTKAGAETPATAAGDQSANEGRSRNPGDSRLRVAQRRPEPKPRRQCAPGSRRPEPKLHLSEGEALNEGRSRNPGDRVGRCGDGHCRSTKAGAETPATDPYLERSTKAGAETPATARLALGAQRRPEPKPRRQSHLAAGR